jgi:hypothetical protein
MNMANFLFAYLSPETVVPVASVVAAALGGLMFLTKGSIRFLGRCVRGALRRPQQSAALGKPHFPIARPTIAKHTRD